jgi:hypothetical protein
MTLLEDATAADGAFPHPADFKWLMTGPGGWIDLARFPRDPGCARMRVHRGPASGWGLFRH